MILRTLKNGVIVIINPMNDRSSASLVVLVRAGSDYETRRKNGISHSFEHIGFKGSHGYRRAIDVARAIEGGGGHPDAGTLEDFVRYSIDINYRNFGEALDVLSDMVCNPLISEDEFERERQVIIEEILGRSSDPKLVLEEAYDEMLYPGHPAGFPIAGSVDTVSAVTHEELLEYFRSFYTGKNLVVCVSGRVGDEEKIFEEVERRFINLAPGTVNAKQPLKKSQKSPRIKVFRGTADNRSRLVVGVHAVPLRHPLCDAVEFLSIILGGNMSSRLFNVIREDRGLAYDIHAKAQVFSDRGFLYAYSECDPSNMLEIVSLILAEYKKVSEEGISREELERTKSYVIGEIERAIDNPSSASVYFAWRALMGIETDAQKAIESIERISEEQMLKAARHIFVRSNLNIAILGRHRRTKLLNEMIASWNK